MELENVLPAASPRVNGAAAEDLAAALRGELIDVDHEDYDAVRRVWNGMIDRRPALIAQCAGSADVVTCVNFAREHDLIVSVRAGGHSFPGHCVCDHGLVIDLSRMRGIRVDPASRTARAEPGLLLGAFDRETQALDLATTSGTVSHTGISGLTLGGGQGWLMGKHGLTIDNLLSVDIVTADGRLRTASSSENEDLFWAVRGAGSNFGVVTSFEYRLHTLEPKITAGMILYPLDQAREVLRFYRDHSIDSPDELMMIGAFLTLPDGTPAVALLVAWLGDAREGDAKLQPIRAFGTPLADMVGETTYIAFQQILDAAVPHGMHRYMKMGYVRDFDDDLIDVVTEQSAQVTSPYSATLFNVLKGGVCRVPSDATAFPHREPQWHFEMVAQWTDASETDEHMAWVRDFWDDAQPFMQGTGVNFLTIDDGADRVRAAYGPNYDQLVDLKTKYDPTNFFRSNNNIPPHPVGDR